MIDPQLRKSNASGTRALFGATAWYPFSAAGQKLAIIRHNRLLTTPEYLAVSMNSDVTILQCCVKPHRPGMDELNRGHAS
jgi:hypothetical protein